MNATTKSGIDRYFTKGEVIDLDHCIVTKQDIVEFASKYDPQPYHVDETAGSHSHFNGLVASGWHTAALWMRLYVNGLLHRLPALGSPGVDELRWLSPVRPGDKLYGLAEISSTSPSLSDNNVITVETIGSLRRSEQDIVYTLKLHSRFLKPHDRNDQARNIHSESLMS